MDETGVIMVAGFVEKKKNQPMSDVSVTALSRLLVDAIYHGGEEQAVFGGNFEIHHGKRKSFCAFNGWRLFEYDHTKKQSGYSIDVTFNAVMTANENEINELLSHIDMTTKGCWSWDSAWHKEAEEKARAQMFYYYN